MKVPRPGASLAVAARPLDPSTGRALLGTDLDQMNANVCRKGLSTDCSQLEGYSSDCGALCAYDFRWCSEATQFGLQTFGFGLLGINECP